MGVTLLAVVVGLVSGYLAGGGHAHLGRFRVRGAVLPPMWVALHLIAERSTVRPAVAVMIAAEVCALIFVVANLRRVRGIWLFGLGITLNLVVLTLNGTMPYRTDALHSAGIGDPRLALEPRATAVSRPERPGDRVTFLADIIPVKAGPLHEVLSVGDLLVALGSGLMVFQALQPPGSRPRVPRRDPLATVPEPLPDPVPEPLPDPVPAPAPDPVPEPLPDPVPAPAPDPVPEPLPDPVPAPAPAALDQEPEPHTGGEPDEPDHVIDLTASPGRASTSVRPLDLLLLHAGFERKLREDLYGEHPGGSDADDATAGDTFWEARQQLLDRRRP